MTLANILRVGAPLHRLLSADTELCPAIAVLARAHQDATWRRIKAHNELRSILVCPRSATLAYAVSSAASSATSGVPSPSPPEVDVAVEVCACRP